MKKFQALVGLLLALAIATADCNSEGDALNAWKSNLMDPNNVLQSWDPTLINPCTWFHVTCNADNRVVRLDLGNANLSGPLVPQLGILIHLQYLEVYENKISGVIPRQLGNLTNLVSLDLYRNSLSGSIPPSLGNLKSLRFLRLNGNRLSGRVPIQVIRLIFWGNLQIMNLSDNRLQGRTKRTKGFSLSTIIQDPRA